MNAMFDALQDFNAFDVETNSYDDLPRGDYICMITDCQVKPTKAGTGRYVEYTMEVLEGEHKGRRLWDRLNLDNPNKQAVDIAKKTLASMCKAVGTPLSSGNPADLVESILLVHVTYPISKKSGEPEQRLSYKPPGAVAQQAERSSAAAKPATTGRKPWER